METVNKADLILKLIKAQLEKIEENKKAVAGILEKDNELTDRAYWKKRSEYHNAQQDALVTMQLEIEKASSIFALAGIELK